MICFPNAKINLGLRIVNKRTDGYHNIETIFYPIPLKDALEIVPATDFSFKQIGIPIHGNPEDNFVIKALNALKEKYEIPPVEIYLKKTIPFGAGLGGGSSDAAFMLKLLNKFANLHLPDNILEEIASTIGADCSFFIQNKPVMASGIGNIFEQINLSLKGYIIYIIKPNVFVSTKEAYSLVKPSSPSISLREIVKMPVEEWKNAMVNDFESSVFSQYPVISEIKDKLYILGATYASMSGSGSSVYGLFKEDIKPDFEDCFIWKGTLE